MNSDPVTGILVLLFALALFVCFLAGLRFTAGLFAFIATALLSIIVWPLGIVVILAIAGYGLAKASHA